MAAALRAALEPDDLSEVNIRLLLEAAARTGDRRRQLRRSTTPALLLSSAAAVAGCIVGVGLLLPGGTPETSAAQTAAVAVEDQRSAFLGLSEVQTVVPEAGYALQPAKYWPTPPGEPLWTACGLDALPGITPPAAVQRGYWFSRVSAAPRADGALQDVGENAASTAPGTLAAVVATFASAEQAADYTRAFEASGDSCVAAGEVPLYLAVAPVAGVDGTALLPPDRDREGLDVYSRVWDLQDGRWHVSSVVVRDEVAVRLDAVVPAGSEEAAGSTYRAAVTAVDDLAVLAVDRAVAS